MAATTTIDAARLLRSSPKRLSAGITIVSTDSATRTIRLNSDASRYSTANIAVIGNNAAAGSYTILSLTSGTTLKVKESIVSTSGGGLCSLYLGSGANVVGVDPTYLSNSSSRTVQTVIADLDAAISGGGLTESAHKGLRQLIHLADGGGPFESFTSGATCTLTGGLFPTSSIWKTNDNKKIVEEVVTRNPNKTIATRLWKAYDTDGTTVLATVTDTYSYSGITLTSKTRAIV